MGKIFISYRRKDAAHATEQIYKALASNFGPEAIFRDIDDILFGSNFVKRLDAALGECDIMIAVIGDRWLKLLKKFQKKRKTDHVLFEIRTALDREIPLIPVLVEGTTMPEERELPTELRTLSHCSAAEVRPGLDFETQLQRLVHAIEHWRAKARDLWDVFIWHAPEDKSNVADPIYKHLNSVGISCRYDRGEILWAPNVLGKINEAPKRSRVFIAVISAALLRNNWATMQMILILCKESLALPLIVGSDEEFQELANEPIVHNDTGYIRWTGNVNDIEAELRELIHREMQR